MTMIQPTRPKPARTSKIKGSLTETDLHYRQSIMVLIGLVLLVVVSVASFCLLEAETAVKAIGVAASAIIVFFKTIPQIGGKRK